jgi:short subunit fatty acids transporter
LMDSAPVSGLSEIVAFEGGNGFWALVPFIMQMVMVMVIVIVIVGGHVVAAAAVAEGQSSGLPAYPVAPEVRSRWSCCFPC